MTRSRSLLAPLVRCLLASSLGLVTLTGAAAHAAGKSSAAATAAAAKKKCISSAEDGQTLRAEGKLSLARASFAQCTQSECPAPVRKDCGRWIDEVDAATPTVSVRLQGPGGDEVEGGQVEVDGAPLVQTDHGRATPIDPGTHVFEWTRPEGHVRVEVVLHEGERNKIVQLRAPGGAAASGEMTSTTSDGSGTANGAESGGTSAASARMTSRPSQVPWIVSGGVALASAGVGFVLWGIGHGEHGTLEDGCATTHSCSSSDVNSSRDKLIVGDVLVGVGIVAAATAVYFFVKSRGHDDAPARTAATLPVTLTPGGVGFSF